MKNKKVWIVILILVVAVAGGLIGVLEYRKMHQQMDLEELQQTARIFENTTVEIEESEVSEINFAELRKSNEDIIAWVEVPGTNVDYPILQSSADMEDDFYLSHNVDGSGGYPGCIYIQKVNHADFNDPVTVVYGHDMKDGSMFHTLHDFEDLKFFEENKTFYVHTPTEKKTYRIVAVTTYDDRLIPDYFHNFESEQDVSAFIGSIFFKEPSMIDHFDDGEGIDETDHFVILSTCTQKSDERWLVIGVLESDL